MSTEIRRLLEEAKVYVGLLRPFDVEPDCDEAYEIARDNQMAILHLLRKLEAILPPPGQEEPPAPPVLALVEQFLQAAEAYRCASSPIGVRYVPFESRMIEAREALKAALKAAPPVEQEPDTDCDNDVGRRCKQLWPTDRASWCVGCLNTLIEPPVEQERQERCVHGIDCPWWHQKWVEAHPPVVSAPPQPEEKK
jgi:hypothetical protein